MIVVGYLVGFRFTGGPVEARSAALRSSRLWLRAQLDLRLRRAHRPRRRGCAVGRLRRDVPARVRELGLRPRRDVPRLAPDDRQGQPGDADGECRALSRADGTPHSLAGALAWIGGLLAVFVPLRSGATAGWAEHAARQGGGAPQVDERQPRSPPRAEANDARLPAAVHLPLRRRASRPRQRVRRDGALARPACRASSPRPQGRSTSSSAPWSSGPGTPITRTVAFLTPIASASSAITTSPENAPGRTSTAAATMAAAPI